MTIKKLLSINELKEHQKRVQEELNNKVPKFEYLSGPAGSAKSEVLIDYAIYTALNKKEKVIYTIPSIITANEIANRFIEKGYIPHIIHSKNKNCDSSISKLVYEYMKNLYKDAGCVLILTHTSFQNIEYFPPTCRQDEWIIIHDEAFDPTVHIELNLSEHKDFIFKWIDRKKTFSIKEHLSYIPVTCAENISKKQLISMVRNVMGDEIYSHLYNYHQAILHTLEKRGELFVHYKYWESFINNTGKKFVATKIVTPVYFSRFKKVIFAGANFEKEILYNVWKDVYDVKWKENYSLKKKLRFDKHYSKVIVNYIFDEENFNWSKYHGNTKYNNKSIFEILSDLAVSQLDTSKEILFLGNKNSNIPKVEKIKVCEYNNQGLNQYSGIDQVIYTGAFNRAPAYYDFMLFLECHEYIKPSQTSGHFYQTILRTNIRKNEENSITNIFVPAKNMFAGIEHLFDNIEYRKIETDLAQTMRELCMDKRKKKTPLTPRERTQKHRTNKRNYTGGLRPDVFKSCYPLLEEETIVLDDTKEVDLENETNVVNLLKDTALTTFSSLTNKIGTGVSAHSLNEIEYTREDRENIINSYNLILKTNKIENKEENILGGSFILKKGTIDRKRTSVLGTWGLFFDFDTPNMERPITVSDIQKVVGTRTFVYLHSTFSGGSRRRAIIFYDRLLTPDEHIYLSTVLYGRLNELYPYAKIDMSCVRPESIFYLPCQTSNKKTYVEYKGDSTFYVDEYFYLGSGPTFKNKIDADHYKSSHRFDYSKYHAYVKPYVDKIKPGDRFFNAQKAIGVCASVCPDYKDKLFIDLYEAGVDLKRLDKLEEWFNTLI